MQLPALLSLLLAAAVPALTAPLSTYASASWSLLSLSRTCTAGDTSCTWTFSVDNGTAPATACVYVVNATGAAANASRAGGGPTGCGDGGLYTVTSGWSGQFGPGEGFTTLSVVNAAAKLVAYPSYTDKMLRNATVVVPDLSFPVQTLA